MTESPAAADILSRIEQFCEKHSIPPSRFGRDAIGDGSLIKDWKEGRRSPTLKTVARVENFMAEYTPQKAAA